MDKAIGFIGAGNMGYAMIKSIAQSNIVNTDRIYVYDVDRERLEKLKEETGVSILESGREVVEKSDIVILAKAQYTRNCT